MTDASFPIVATVIVWAAVIAAPGGQRSTEAQRAARSIFGVALTALIWVAFVFLS